MHLDWDLQEGLNVEKKKKQQQKSGRVKSFLCVFDSRKSVLQHPGCYWVKFKNLILEMFSGLH